MNPIVAILITAAAKVGAPIVKGILQQHVGGAASEIGGTVIDAIAAQAGVTPDELPGLPLPNIETAIAEVEKQAPELILAEVEQQRESNRLMLAEMNKETSFGWMWRPAGMWLMLVCVAWYIVVVPLLNAVLAALGSGTNLALIVDFASFVPVFMTYAGLYMGGNTVIRSIKK